eukprot:COSAG02_NODE_6109_length_3791_cov_241.041441_7_plen_62_part_00
MIRTVLHKRNRGEAQHGGKALSPHLRHQNLCHPYEMLAGMPDGPRTAGEINPVLRRSFRSK